VFKESGLFVLAASATERRAHWAAMPDHRRGPGTALAITRSATIPSMKSYPSLYLRLARAAPDGDSGVKTKETKSIETVDNDAVLCLPSLALDGFGASTELRTRQTAAKETIDDDQENVLGLYLAADDPAYYQLKSNSTFTKETLDGDQEQLAPGLLNVADRP
jgi:hypothetical protein